MQQVYQLFERQIMHTYVGFEYCNNQKYD